MGEDPRLYEKNCGVDEWYETKAVESGKNTKIDGSFRKSSMLVGPPVRPLPGGYFSSKNMPYFHLSKDSDTGKKLTEFLGTVKAAREKQKSIISELFPGEEIDFCWSNYYVCGGISGFKLEEKPEGWKNTKNANGYYFPKKTKANKGILERLDSIPTIRKEEMARLLSYKYYTGFEGDKMVASSAPGVQELVSGDFIITIAEFVYDQWKRTDDYKEISYGEYREYIGETEEEKA